MTHQPAAATWKATLGQLELLVTRANFDTWLRDTIGLRHEHDRFVVGAQTDFATEWLSTRLRPLISKTLARVVGHALHVDFEVARAEGDPSPVLLAAASGAPDTSFDNGTIDAATAASASRVSRGVPPALNPALTFDAFVIGEENSLAFEAARRAASDPGSMNPLLIFGASGLGKTHLLNAIGHAAFSAGRNVIYAPAERFGNDYVRALADGKIEQFRSRYRGCDLLLLDDVQFLEGKEKFQAEFFHAFNDLHAAGKQIVITSDRAPSQLTGLSEALRSRFQWGLAADLQKPGYETRLAILRAKAPQHALPLPDDALVTIAERCCPTVRELEGFLNRVIAYVPLVGGALTPEVIEKALNPLAAAANSADSAPPTADAIVGAVCARTGAQPADLRGRSRNRELTYARHLAMYMLKEDARKSVAEICRLMGNRDHSTVLSGISRITLELTTRPETTSDLAEARTTIAERLRVG